jgi:hypothetical protein
MQELLRLHAVDHDAEGGDQVPEIVVDAFEAHGHGRSIQGFVFGHLFDLVEDEPEVELGDLVVEDEDFLIGEGSARVLQAQQGVQVHVLPVGEVVGVDQAVQVGAHVLTHRGVLALQGMDAVDQVLGQRAAAGLALAVVGSSVGFGAAVGCVGCHARKLGRLRRIAQGRAETVG